MFDLLEEKIWFWTLLIIPVIIVLFLLLQIWKRSAQSKFADKRTIGRLSPNRSFFKSVLKIINILNEIIGQIRGNTKLKAHFTELLSTIEVLVSDKRKLTEPRKRAVVSELRERLRHLNIKNIDNLVGDKE